MKLFKYLGHGFSGHPIHPPLTDFTIGIYTGATAFAVLHTFGVSESNMAIAWWLALLVGLISTVPTAVTGFIDWLDISSGSPLWRTATAHMIAMIAATVLFLLAAVLGHGDYVDREVGATPLLLNLGGFLVLSVGGWLGGSVVYVYGMRVLALTEEPAKRAVAPAPKPEKEAADEAGGAQPPPTAPPG